MNKEEFKNIVSEILGNNDSSAFNQFIAKIATSIKGKEALRLDGIGHFQIKKEPLSRMERRAEGDINEKEILLFLPEGKSGEENILSFDIDSESEFNDSVFDVSINKPTIISESEDNEEVEKSEKLSKNISEFVESGDIIEDYELLNAHEVESPADISENNITPNTDEIIIDDIIENDGDFTEAEINKEFLNVNDGDAEAKDEYEMTSSNMETVITEEDLHSSQEGIDENIETNEEGLTEDTEDTNPFDELENYIKDESTDEAQEIIDSEPEQVIEEVLTENKVDTTEKIKKQSKFTKFKFDEWYKKPILYISVLSIIVVGIVIFMFFPSSEETEIVEEGGTVITNVTKHNEFGVVDSTTSEDSAKEHQPTLTNSQVTDKKMSEVKKVEESTKIIKEEISKPNNNIAKSAKKETGLYRKIENDRSVKGRIYFDGNLYTVQSSSWRSTSIAEREVSKLKKRGFDAFIYKVFIKSKNGTWNRVRIGYFNSQKEAEEFLKKNKI